MEAGIYSPQWKKFIQGQAALRSDAERTGYDLAHSGPTLFRMRIPAETRIEVLKFALRELESMTSKIARAKAKLIVNRLKQLEETTA